MRAAVVGLMCVLGVALLGTATARADKKVGDFAPDFSPETVKTWINTEDGQPETLPQRRGMIVLLFFWSTWDQAADQLLPLMTLLNSSQYGKANGVYTIGLTDAEQTRVADQLKKQKVFFPVGFDARKAFEEYEVTQPPRVFIIDPAGKIAWSGPPDGNAMVRELSTVATATPPTMTHPEFASKANAYLKEARQALGTEDYREAHEAAQKAYDIALRGDVLKTRCQDMLDLIEAVGRDKLSQADQATDDKKYQEAVTLLMELRREFKGMEVATIARKRLDALRKKNKEVADIIAQIEAGGQAENLLAGVMDDLKSITDKNSPDQETIRRKVGSAFVHLEEIVNVYSTTSTAKKAQTIMERIQKNEGIMGYVRDFRAEKPCLSLLTQADAFLQRGDVKRARDLYAEVVEKYGDTIWSKQAEQRLSELP